MKSILIILLFFTLSVSAQKDTLKKTDQFTCSIHAEKNIYKIGETPNITVEIKNNSKESGYLVKVLDGSEAKWRFPYAYFVISKVGDTSYKTNFYGRCGNMNEITLEDFVEVKPGTIFNPYKPTNQLSVGETNYAYDFDLKDVTNFAKRGKYRITFFYSSIETDLSKWRGRAAGVLRQDELQRINNLFSKTIHKEMISNTLLIEIK